MKIPGPKYAKHKKEWAEKSFGRPYKLSVASGHEKFFTMDNETYCPVDPSQVPGNEYYNLIVSELTSERPTSKFTLKSVARSISSSTHKLT